MRTKTRWHNKNQQSQKTEKYRKDTQAIACVCQSGRYCAQQQQQQPKETHKSHKSKKETSPASGCVLFTCVHASPSILTRVVGGVGNNDFFMTSRPHCDAYTTGQQKGTEQNGRIHTYTIDNGHGTDCTGQLNNGCAPSGQHSVRRTH